MCGSVAAGKGPCVWASLWPRLNVGPVCDASATEAAHAELYKC